MSPAANSGSPTPPAEPEKPKSTWEKVIVSTPILLTIIATLFAGMSSSEMTRAQYFRAVAAQNQSKVSDQWNFFQAKRIRGTDLDDTAILLRSTTGAGQLSPNSLRGSAKRLSEYFQRADKEADTLTKTIGGAALAADLAAPAERFHTETKKGVEVSQKLVKTLDELAWVKLTEESVSALETDGVPSEVLSKLTTLKNQDFMPWKAFLSQLDKALSKEELVHSLPTILNHLTRDPNIPLIYLAEDKVPARNALSEKQRAELKKSLEPVKPDIRESLKYFDDGLLKTLHELNPAIPAAVWEVNERKTEREMGDTLPKIKTEEIHKAIDDGEKVARQFEAACAPITGTFRDLDKLIAEQTGVARSVYRRSQEVSFAAAPLTGNDAKVNELHQAAQTVERAGTILKSAADEFGNDYKAAQLRWDSRRYDREARDNQTVAGLYELDVRKASLESDRHRQRSSNFFYAMLAAQGGVTIATFSIAMRRKSLLWGLATAAGLAAITFGGYVFLTM